MNSLKPLILLTILGGVGFGVYRSLNKAPVDPPPGADTALSAVPEIQLGEAQSPAASNLSAKGPNVLQPSVESSAPPFHAAAPAHPESPATSDATPPAPNVGSAALMDAGRDSVSDKGALRHSDPFAAQAQPNVDQSVAGLDAGTSSAATMNGAKFATAWSTIQPKLAAGQLAEALKDLTAWYGHPTLTAAEHETVNRLLNELAGTVIYSREHLLAEPYRVQAGETLTDIAAKHRVTPELLAKINGLDPAAPAVKVDDEIKVVPGPFSAVVDVGADRLTLMLDGCYAGSFSLAAMGKLIATRVESGTPAEFTVVQKTAAPIYNSAQGEVETGDPANPLGDYLLALSGELAIHGTNPRAAPQTEQPSGGIRVSAADITDVYDILTVGSRVIVRK